jgi:predicted N-acetyltransferase YhbS
MIVRPEAPGDLAAIREVNIAAFLHHPFSQQTEYLIVEALRAAGALKSLWSLRSMGTL